MTTTKKKTVWEDSRATHKASGTVFAYEAIGEDYYGNLIFRLTNLETGERKKIKESTLMCGYKCWKKK